uniref:Uncharacterized protein n=1 Tax=Anopheles atroparvus TaxID=41427 RepID=A0AAG5DMD9_ANOAO
MRRIVTLAVVLGSLSCGHCAKKPSAPPTAVPPTPNLQMVYMEPDRMEKIGEQRFAIYCYAGQNQTWKD